MIRHERLLSTFFVFLGVLFFILMSSDHIALKPERKRALYQSLTSDFLNLDQQTIAPECSLKEIYAEIDEAQILKDLESIRFSCEEYHKNFSKIFHNQSWLFQDVQKAIWEYSSITGRANTLVGFLKLHAYKNVHDKKIAKIYKHVCNQTMMYLGSIQFIRYNLICLPKKRLDYGYQFYFPIKKYKEWIQEIRRYKEHFLSTAAEQTLHIKSVTSKEAWLQLYTDTLNDIVIPEDQSSAKAEQTQKVRTPPSVLQKIDQQLSLFTRILNNLFLDRQVDATCHNFSDPFEAEYFRAQLDSKSSEASLKNLSSVYAETSHRYYALKAKILGQNKLRYCDLDKPVLTNSFYGIPWDQARETILTSIKHLGPSIYGAYKAFFQLNYIEAVQSSQKKAVAFSQPLSADHSPYLFLKYDGTLRDLFVLAKLLGEGVSQKMAYFDCSDVLATPRPLFQGVFGAFSELMLFDYLLSKASTAYEEASLLCVMIERKLKSWIENIALHSLEHSLYGHYKKANLIASDLGSEWLSFRRNYLGPSVAAPLAYSEWVLCESLFFQPFCDFLPIFSENIANNLFLHFKKETDPKFLDASLHLKKFAQDYLGFMNSGFNFSLENLKDTFNIDLADKNFWNNGINLLEKWISRLDELLARNPELCS